MIENIKEVSEQISEECIAAINKDLDEREFDQILSCAEKIPIPIMRYETILKIAKIATKYDIPKALYAIRRQPMLLYAQSQADIAYEIAKNGDRECAKIIANCIIDRDMRDAALQNINDLS